MSIAGPGMTTSNFPTASTGRYKRSVRNLLIDSRFQLKYTGLLVLAALVVSVLLGGFLYATSREVVAESGRVVEESKKVSDVVMMSIKDNYGQDTELASAFTEEAAKARGYEVVVQKDAFGGNGRARILGETEGLVKVVAELGPDGRAGRILGVHMVGPWVTEQLGQGYLAVNWEATPDEISQFIQPHPSLSETFGETVIALTGRGLHAG